MYTYVIIFVYHKCIYLMYSVTAKSNINYIPSPGNELFWRPRLQNWVCTIFALAM